MPQAPVTEDLGTPIFDTLAAEVGFEWIGWFDPKKRDDSATSDS